MLTEAAIKSAKPAEKPYRLYDERGMYLLVNSAKADSDSPLKIKSRLWRLKYRIAGREKLLALGAYPEVSLKEAREKRDESRRLVASGVDPLAQKMAKRVAAADTFSALAAEYLETKRKTLHPKTLSKAQWLLDDWLGKYIGSKPVRQLTAADVLGVCRRLESKGKHESAHRARALASRVMRYGVATGRCERDPCADLRGALTPVKVKNHAAITEPTKLGELLRAIDGYEGQPSTAYALKIAPYVFVRPGELRHAQWSEFDLDAKEPIWRIPPGRMKMREQHIVPLAPQVVELLKQLERFTGDGALVFPSLTSSARPISDNTMNTALRRMGYTREQIVAHGFRSTASTLLNEQGWHPDLIELQLAHAERNKVRAAYNRAERLPERRKMLLSWADYLDALKKGKATKVVNIGRGRGKVA
jgi:integrase